ncbi:TetR/AcrR family transcriptional regulator [Pseudonocardia humida]|uniref:TetR/AcrR family transcriptional regulator n=1 Tax=Pseudonocardia humida TaxID=2800819 RepID=A0ABT0ZXR0_9PSEU|nr:TetR/AcrR family transcriptional regulator [Pseudonocardia humida]MCO1655496.1 TetR/AcrR family transcriptional regulator [Pseudonocardia humida]
MSEPPERRAVILDSAARLFAGKGIAATTVREIADSVGVLSGSLYHHFPSKSAIVDEVVDSYLRDLLAAYRDVLRRDRPPRELVRELVAASVRATGRHPHAADVYRRERRRPHRPGAADRLDAAAAEVTRSWLTVLDRGRADGSFRTDVPTWVAYRLIRDGLLHCCPPARPGALDPAAELAETVSALVLDGLGAHDRRRGNGR